jgi:DNA phosphorothioation-associated putative methyltransferase
MLIDKGLLSSDDIFFDYGCGHGQDLEILSKNGFLNCSGWDPYYRSNQALSNADIVNLGFVLNVVENPAERREALQKAFSLANKALCVSVMTKAQRNYEGKEYLDGVISSTGTFQKFYDQVEIKNYLEQQLEKDAIAVEPGIFLVFKCEKQKLSYLQNRYKKAAVLEYTRLDPITHEETKVHVFRPKLEELIEDSAFFKEVGNFILEYGRLPKEDESEAYRNLVKEFKSKMKIENILLSNIDEESFLDIRAQRIEELLVFFALRRFDKTGFPKKTDLPSKLANDINAFFKNYKELLNQSTALLFSLGNDKMMREAHKHIKIGKLLPDAVYLHPRYIDQLPPPIQVKIGVAQKLIGEIDGCNLIKINKLKEKVSFMVYEDFDKVPHPALLYTVVVDLPKMSTKLWDFETRANPPILHRKETFVGEDYPGYSKFKKLTLSEEKAGLLSRNDIGTRNGWKNVLEENGRKLSGHTLRKA